MRPHVSVIIPAYNEEAFLPKCLNSLKKQKTSIPFEVIVVDNNSTDRTKTIAKRYGCRVIFEPKKGASIARNTGARYAKGDIFIFLDADCVTYSNHIEIIRDHWKQIPEEEVITGLYVVSDAGPFMRWITDRASYYKYMFLIQQRIFGKHGLVSGNFAITSKTFHAVGGFDEKLTNIIMAEDTELASRLFQKGYMVTIKENLKVLTSYRRIKKSPFSTTFIRTYYVIKHLTSS